MYGHKSTSIGHGAPLARRRTSMPNCRLRFAPHTDGLVLFAEARSNFGATGRYSRKGHTPSVSVAPPNWVSRHLLRALRLGERGCQGYARRHHSWAPPDVAGLPRGAGRGTPGAVRWRDIEGGESHGE